MSSQSSQVLPSSFDPAIHFVSEPQEVECSQTEYSDDVEALNLVQEELRVDKAEKGLVIQHRAWKLRDVFRSEDGGWFSGYGWLIVPLSLIIRRKPNVERGKSASTARKPTKSRNPIPIFTSNCNNALHFVPSGLSGESFSHKS